MRIIYEDCAQRLFMGTFWSILFRWHLSTYLDVKLRLNKLVKDFHSFRCKRISKARFKDQTVGNTQQFAPCPKWNAYFLRLSVGTSFDLRITVKNIPAAKALQTLLALTAIIPDSMKLWGNVSITPLYNLQRFHLEGIPLRQYVVFLF